MAAGLGFKTFTTGEVLTAADTNGYLMQGINVFANSAARAAAITSPQEGQYSYLKDTNALEYYDGAAWVGAPVGDITAVTAGKGLTGGGSSGDVTVSLATTAKGDLVAGSGASTAAVLTVGNNGETLVADSSTSTGLRYQASMAAGRNGTINGGMDIWQRGTSISLAAGTGAASGFTSDRWFLPTGTNQASTVSRQSVNDSTNLPNIQYCARVQRNSGQTGTAAMAFNYNFETANSIPFAGKTITVSFYARAGANYSPTSSVLASQLYTGTGTDQNIQVGGFTGQNLAVNQSNTLTTTWQRFSYTYAVPSTVTQFAYIFLWTPTGTAGTNDYFEITGVQMELGSVATNFSRAGGNIQGELAACQRYYTRLANVGSATEYWFGSGYAGTSTQAQCILPLTSTMRSSTITLDYSGVRLQDYGAGYAISALVYVSSARNNIVVGATSSGMTANRPMAIDTNTTGYIGISAEL